MYNANYDSISVAAGRVGKTWPACLLTDTFASVSGRLFTHTTITLHLHDLYRSVSLLIRCVPLPF